MRYSTENAYQVMMSAVQKGRCPAAIPAVDQDGDPMLFFTSVEYTGSPSDGPFTGLVWAAAVTGRAYDDANAAGVKVLI